MIIFFLETQVPLLFSTDMRVLHLAPEHSLGRLLRSIRTLRYETADLEAKGVDHLFDLQETSLAPDSYDLILANHILEHIPRDAAALLNIFRMLKPGAFAMITVPIRVDSEETDDDSSVVDPDERKRRFGAANHLRFYGKKDLITRIGKAGLVASTWEPRVTGAHADRFAMGGEVLFLGTKP